MIANKLTILTATAALLEPALALGHRHAHQHVQKRGDWITATIDGQVVSWENNYFGGAAAPAATQPAAASQPEAPAAPAPAAPQATTIIKVAKPSQAAKPASKPAAEYKEPQKAAAASTKAVVKEQAVKATTPKKTKSSSSSSSGGSVGFSHKRGVCYNDVDLANTFASECENCGWGYNWDSDSGGLKGLNFIPTLWNDQPLHTDRFAANCEKALNNGAKAIFSFNEPDNAGQANMSPAAAAKAHVKWMNPYAGKALIGAPSISNSGNAGEGVEWLTSFVSECESEGCHYDFCNVHWYSGVEYGETLFDHLEASHKACGGKPIWLTEFAPAGSDEAIAEWLKDAIPRLEDLSYLDAYSYFKVESGMLMTSASQLSSYGSVYASA
ncbi:glycoside hydrolase [Fusarium heterosporum]|uniref:Glycoside hydrolase n=1 Tax=Fusarium heterosporum TaxID=42747 RepID=A0A8H5TY61_FUSHE|nr:glycoside hydrolase [Fusarium heterosporum]